jgi:hypothetical protein
VSAFENLVGMTYRIVYESDPVPHNPRPFFYAHVGHAIWIHDGKLNLKVCCPRWCTMVTSASSNQRRPVGRMQDLATKAGARIARSATAPQQTRVC